MGRKLGLSPFYSLGVHKKFSSFGALPITTGFPFFIYRRLLQGGNMSQQLRKPSALSEEQNLVPNTQVGSLTSACNDAPEI